MQCCFVFKQKTAYEVRMSDWSSDVCSADLKFLGAAGLWPVMGYGYWVFADRADDRLVGMGGLAYFCRGIAELEGFPEAGWAFDADHWGAGLATEAMGDRKSTRLNSSH